MRGWTLTATLVMLAVAWGCAVAPTPEPLPEEQEKEDPEATLFGEYLEKLESDEWSVRDQASRDLVKQGRLDLIEKALKRTQDPEVRWRLEAVLRYHRAREASLAETIEKMRTGKLRVKSVTITNIARPN